MPCHPDALAMAYALKLDGKVVPLTRFVEPDVLINAARNTIVYEEEPACGIASSSYLQRIIRRSRAPAACVNCCAACRKLPRPPIWGTRIFFRVLIVQFLDAHAFDVRSVKKTCIHIVHPDGRLIPFDTYNLFYRDELEHTRLAALRQPSNFVSLTAASIDGNTRKR